MIKDQITLARIGTLANHLQSESLMIYEEAQREIETSGLKLRYACCRRTNQEQDELYKQGRSIRGSIVTDAKGGESYHNYGLAIDICLITPENGLMYDLKLDKDNDGVPEWFEIARIFKKYGWEWGGNWTSPKKDYPHFQKTGGLTIEQLKLAAK